MTGQIPPPPAGFQLQSPVGMQGQTGEGSEGSNFTPQQVLARNMPFVKPGAASFYTSLSPQQEQQFRAWVKASGAAFDTAAKTPDYDMRGFWLALQNKDPKATTAIDQNDGRIHYPDYWKTPYDATFSAQSKFAGQGAPDWKGDQLVLPNGKVVYDDKTHTWNGAIPPPPPGFVIADDSAALNDAYWKADAAGDEAGKLAAFRQLRAMGGKLGAPSDSALLQRAPEADPSATGQVKEGAMAIAHHLANIPLGAAQLLGHGVTAAADAMSGQQDGQRTGVAGALDATNANFDNYMRQREAGYQAVVPNSPAAYTGAAVGEVAPWLAGIGELRAAGMIPTATTAIGKLATLAGEGTAMGATQPVTGGNYAREKALQVGVGALTGPGLYGAGKLAGGVGKVAQHVLNPQAVADANLAGLYGSAPETLAALRQARAFVPGEAPSAAQALQTPEAVAAERVLRNNPASKLAFAHQENANNAARQGVVERLAGTPESMEAARATRRANAQPFIESALTPSQPATRWQGAGDAFKTVLDAPARLPAADFDAVKQASGIVAKVRSGALQEDDAMEALGELGDSVTSAKARRAFEAATDAIDKNMVDPSGVLRTIATLRNGPLGVNPRVAEGLDFLSGRISSGMNARGKIGTDVLDAVRQEASKLLGKAKVPGSAVGTQQGIAFGPAKNQIVEAIERVAPGYRDYVARYRNDSTPINTMASVRKLVDPNAPGSLNTAGDPQLAISRLRQVLRGDDKAKFPMSRSARDELDGVLKSLLRRSVSDNKLSASGPGTAADLQAQGGLSSLVFGPNLGARGGLASRLIGAPAGAALGYHFGPMGAIVGSGIGGMIGDALGAANNRVISRVGESAADSKKTADAIERYLNTRRGQSTLSKLMFGLEAPAAKTPAKALPQP